MQRAALAACVLFLSACRQAPPVEVMSQWTISGWLGLWTNPNDVDLPKGALAVADDVVIDRPGILEPRRGFAELEGVATITGPINSMAFFQGYLIAHHSTSSISRWTGSAWSTYSGSYSAVDSNTKVKLFTAEQSLFALTSNGVYELDNYAGTWRLTGAPQAIDGSGTLDRTSTTSGFATPNGQWAYRALWAYKNTNDRIEYGAPSGRFIVSNPANVTNASGGSIRASNVVSVTQTAHGFSVGDKVDRSPTITNFTAGQFTVATVVDADHFTYAETAGNATSGADLTYGFTARNITLSIPVPSQVTAAALAGTGYFLQLYRSAKSADASTEPPDDALGLVYETVPTNVQIAAGTVSINDITPDSLRAALIYTSTQGVTAAKAQPPQCHDAVIWRDSTWYCDTQTVHSKTITLLGVGGTTGLVSGEILGFRDIIAGGFVVALTAAATADFANGIFQVFTDGTAAQNIANTARSIVRAINAYTSNSTLSAQYVSGDADPPGSFIVYARSLSATAFSPYTVGAVGAHWSPALAEELTITGLSRSSNVVTVTTGFHGYAVGQQVELVMVHADANFPAGIKVVTGTPSSTTWTYAEAGSNATNSQNQIGSSLPTALNRSDDSDFLRGLMYSAPREPWAVPLVNLIQVGLADKNLYSMTPLRDKLVLYTGAGVYQVTGSYPNFQLAELDLTTNIMAPRTAVALNNRAWSFSSKGVVSAYDAIDQPAVSAKIEDKFLPLQTTAKTQLLQQAWAVAYETAKRLVLGLPSSSADTSPSQIYIYNYLTQAWTRWTVAATCGAVDPVSDKLYLGTADGHVLVENKTLTTADYVDDTGDITTVIEPAQIQMDAPGAMKLSDSGNLDFGPGGDVLGAANFSGGVTLKFATDLYPTLESSGTGYAPLGAPTVNQARLNFGVPIPYQRGSAYRVRLSATVSAEHFALRGLTLNYRVTSSKTGR